MRAPPKCFVFIFFHRPQTTRTKTKQGSHRCVSFLKYTLFISYVKTTDARLAFPCWDEPNGGFHTKKMEEQIYRVDADTCESTDRVSRASFSFFAFCVESPAFREKLLLLWKSLLPAIWR